MLTEQMTKYAMQAISKCQTEGYKSLMVKDEAAESFMKYTDDYFGRTVFTTNCEFTRHQSLPRGMTVSRLEADDRQIVVQERADGCREDPHPLARFLPACLRRSAPATLGGL